MNSKKIICLVSVLALFCLAGLVFAQTVTLPDPLGGKSFKDVLTSVTNYASGLIATLAVIMIIISGIVYLTSGGGARMETAKKILVYAVAGIVIALAASGIVSTITSIIK